MKTPTIIITIYFLCWFYCNFIVFAWHFTDAVSSLLSILATCFHGYTMSLILNPCWGFFYTQYLNWRSRIHFTTILLCNPLSLSNLHIQYWSTLCWNRLNHLQCGKKNMFMQCASLNRCNYLDIGDQLPVYLSWRNLPRLFFFCHCYSKSLIFFCLKQKRRLYLVFYAIFNLRSV